MKKESKQPHESDVTNDELKSLDTDVTDEKTELKSVHSSKLKKFWSTKKGKFITIFSVIVIIAAVLLAIPTTRYGALGMVIKKNVKVMVTDSTTNKPISQADVTIDGKSATTSPSGETDIAAVPVGQYTISVTKKYYKNDSTAITVPILSSPQTANISFVATGRQVQFKVANTLNTSAMLEKAVLTVGDTSAATDANGLATIVLPTGKPTLTGTLALDGYNAANVTVNVTEQSGQNNFTLTPAGSVYFVSNQSGALDIMKSNLDGMGQAVLVKGTNNLQNQMSFTVSKDQRYAAFYQDRAGSGTPQLYVIDTQSGSIKQVDSVTDANAYVSGWAGHQLIYALYSNTIQEWNPGRFKIMSYNADSGKLATIDQTQPLNAGNQYNYTAEYLSTPNIVGGKLLYVQTWATNGFLTPPGQAAIHIVNADGTGAQTLKTFDAAQRSSAEQRPFAPNLVVVKISLNGGSSAYYQYDGSSLKASTVNDAQYYSQVPTYYTSPDGTRTAWSEVRNGKNTILVADANANNSKAIADQTDDIMYAWYGNDYLLLTKNNELDIVPATPTSGAAQITKIANFATNARYY